jgi:hypothetical protein
MRRWNCDTKDLRNSCFDAQKIVKKGKRGKYEGFTNMKGRNIKLIINIRYEDTIYIITGAEGHGTE